MGNRTYFEVRRDRRAAAASQQLAGQTADTNQILGAILAELQHLNRQIQWQNDRLARHDQTGQAPRQG